MSESERLVAVAEGTMSYIKELAERAQRAGVAVSLEPCRKKS